MPNLKHFRFIFSGETDTFLFECSKLETLESLKIVFETSERETEVLKQLDDALTNTKFLKNLKSLDIPSSYHLYNSFLKSELVKTVPIINYRGEEDENNLFTKKQSKATCMNLVNENFNINSPEYKNDPLYKKMRIRSYVNEMKNFIRCNFDIIEYFCLQSSLSMECNLKNFFLACNFINLKELRIHEPNSGILESMALIRLPKLEILHLHDKDYRLVLELLLLQSLFNSFSVHLL